MNTIRKTLGLSMQNSAGSTSCTVTPNSVESVERQASKSERSSIRTRSTALEVDDDEQADRSDRLIELSLTDKSGKYD